MPGNVDSLQIKINADASKAIQAIDQVTKHLRELAHESGRSAGGMKAINSSMKELAGSARDAKKVGNPFSEMTKGMKNYQSAVNGVANAGVTINAQSVYFRDLANATGKAGDSASNASNKIRKFGSSLGFLKTSAKIARIALLPLTGAFKIVGNAAQGGIKKLTGFLKSIMRIAMYRAIRSALRAITQALSQGTENLYFFSQAVGSNFAPSMDRLATSMLYLKNGFASMFSPLVEYFTPLIENLVDKLVDAFNWVQRLFAQLTGKTQWNKAVKVQTVYKEATDNTTKAVKKLRQEIQLMDFDELNNITENPDDGSSASTPEVKNPDPVKMFTIEPTNVDPYDEGSFFANLKAWWNDIDPIGKLWEKVKTWWQGIDFMAVGEKVGKTIRNVWERFKTWFKEFDWKAFFDGLKEVLGDLGDFVEGVLRGLFPEQAKAWDERKARMNERSEINKDRDKANNYPLPPKNTFNVNTSANTLEEIATLIAKLTKDRKTLEQQMSDAFSADKIAEFEAVYASRAELQRVDPNTGMSTYDTVYLSNPEYVEWLQIRESMQEVDDAIDNLKKKRQELATKTLALTNKERRAYESVANELSRYGDKTVEIYTTLAEEIPQNTAYIAAKAISEFKESDWRDGGTLAMRKLNKALTDANIPYETRQIALQAAARFGAEKGWTTWTANAAMLIENALWAAEIPDEYVAVARTALKGYLTYVDWANGGSVTANGIMKAFKEAGLPDGVAEVAERAALDYLSGFDGENLGKGSVDDVVTGMTAEWTKNKPTLTTKAKVDTSTIPGDMNKFLSTKDASWKKLPLDLKIATKNQELVDAVNKKIAQLNKEGVKLSQVELEALIRTTADELGIEIDNLIDKTKPKALVVPVKFSGKGVPKLVDDKNPYSGFTMENFARGGFPEMGTMFVAGEMAGQAEMVGNINGRTGVASGQEITGIGDAVWSTGGTTARLISELIEVVREKNLTISPSAALGRTVAKSQRMYATQTG